MGVTPEKADFPGDVERGRLARVGGDDGLAHLHAESEEVL